ncbi:hypothetical protein TL16_g06329 [Triparma laevis f. inornata]|uniref:Uncharacterized protein n=1 Tax=Triparma laevis f. inornata TaxID=1714386 RepID=A0A9W7ANV5_9STRA|nr:hypothetical protein TL16_g06329 [Triparma laevis f. inornata]
MSFDYSLSPSSPSLSQTIPTVDELAVTARRVKNLTQAISDAKDGWKGAEEALGICSTMFSDLQKLHSCLTSNLSTFPPPPPSLPSQPSSSPPPQNPSSNTPASPIIQPTARSSCDSSTFIASNNLTAKTPFSMSASLKTPASEQPTIHASQFPSSNSQQIDETEWQTSSLPSHSQQYIAETEPQSYVEETECDLGSERQTIVAETEHQQSFIEETERCYETQGEKKNANDDNDSCIRRLRFDYYSFAPLRSA